MLKVDINIRTVIETLKANRATHVKEFSETLAAYHAAVIEWFKAQLMLATEGGKYSTYNSKFNQLPESHEGDYTTAIAMLEMSTDDQVTLTTETFEKFMQDNWLWKSAFQRLKSSYTE